MDIDRVRYFQVFADTGSIVRASEVLNISQPALSKALKLLESEVGQQLMEADGRGLKLTAAGKEFKKETQPLLEKWLQIPARLQTQQAVAPTRIGSFEVFTTYFLGALTHHVELASLEVHEYGPGRLEQAVADGLIDVGITYIPIPKPGIDFIELTQIKMGIFGSEKFKNLPFSQLPFAIPLMPIEGTPSRVLGLDGWPEHKIQRNIKYRVTMLESAIELCRRGLCVAYLPRFIVHLHNRSVKNEFCLLEVPSPVKSKESAQSVFLVKRKLDKEHALHRSIAKCLRSLT